MKRDFGYIESHRSDLYAITQLSLSEGVVQAGEPIPESVATAIVWDLYCDVQLAPLQDLPPDIKEKADEYIAKQSHEHKRKSSSHSKSRSHKPKSNPKPKTPKSNSGKG